VLDWWRVVREDTGPGSYSASLRRRYAFLDDLAPSPPVRDRRRAAATIARLSDLGTTPEDTLRPRGDRP
jgi:hypothetical protein